MWENKLGKALESGGIALGTCIDSFSPAVVEVAGYSGLDFIRIDTEYAWRRDDTLEHMIRAAVIADTTAMIRVEKGNQYLISKVLQAGAGAIVVSDIESTREAVEVVKAAKFAPKGFRGYSSFSFSAKWGSGGGKDWIARSDNEIPVGIMIENEQVMKVIDDVFAIDGMDFCLFGPADYSMSIGLGAPNKNDSRVQDALKKTCEAAAKHNKSVATGIGQPWKEEAIKYINMGCRILELGHELGTLRSVWRSTISEIEDLEK